MLKFARFIASVTTELTFAAYDQPDIDIPHLRESFALFNNDDSYLRSRAT